MEITHKAAYTYTYKINKKVSIPGRGGTKTTKVTT